MPTLTCLQLSQIWITSKFTGGTPVGWDFIGYRTGPPAITPPIGTEMLNLGLAGWIQKPPANLTAVPVTPAYDPVVSQPLGTTHISIAYAPSIGGVVTPMWQVWDWINGGQLPDEATLPTSTGVRAPTMAETISTVYYGRWYSLSGSTYTDLGRKS